MDETEQILLHEAMLLDTTLKYTYRRIRPLTESDSEEVMRKGEAVFYSALKTALGQDGAVVGITVNTLSEAVVVSACMEAIGTTNIIDAHMHELCPWTGLELPNNSVIFLKMSICSPLRFDRK